MGFVRGKTVLATALVVSGGLVLSACGGLPFTGGSSTPRTTAQTGIGVNAYLSSEGKAVGSLTFHTSNIKILIFASDTQPVQSGNFSAKKSKKEESDDLPF